MKFFNKFSDSLKNFMSSIELDIQFDEDVYFIGFKSMEYSVEIPIIVNNSAILNVYQLVVDKHGIILQANTYEGIRMFPQVKTLCSPLFDKEELEKIIIEKYNLNDNFRIM